MDLQTEYQFHPTWNQGAQERTSSVLYIAKAMPLPLKSYTSRTVGFDPSCGVYTICNLPGPGATKSVDRYYMRRKVSTHSVKQRASRDWGVAVKQVTWVRTSISLPRSVPDATEFHRETTVTSGEE